MCTNSGCPQKFILRSHMSEKKNLWAKMTKNPSRKFFVSCNFRSTAFAQVPPPKTFSLDPNICAQIVVSHKSQYWGFFTLAECRKGDFHRISCIFFLKGRNCTFSPRLLLYSPYRYPNHKNLHFYQSRKSISNRFVFWYGGFWPLLGGFSGQIGVFLLFLVNFGP